MRSETSCRADMPRMLTTNRWQPRPVRCEAGRMDRTADAAELALLERYYDTVPRVAASTEQVGPFTLFVKDGSTTWDFYARPRLGLDRDVTADDVRRVVARQDELGIPRAIEWV